MSWGDEFLRETLNTPNALTMYTTNINGAGTVTQTDDLVLMTTGGTIGNDAVMGLSELMQQFQVNDGDTFQGPEGGRTKIVYDFLFSTTAGDTEAFVGLFLDNIMTAMPTTTRHCGIMIDQSADANYRVSTGNGSAQAFADTGEAIDTSTHRLRMTWSGQNAMLVEWWSNTDFVNPDFSTSIADLGTININRSYMLNWLIQTEASAAKTMSIQNYLIRWQ